MILRPGHNVWRIEQAGRASVLVDGAAYFRAVRQALRKAERSIFILGWDIHSQTRLVGETGEPDDGYPATFTDFLCELVRERPELQIHVLLWDFAVLYAAEREWLPRWTFGWRTPKQIHFRLDGAVPLGASQHQKIVVVDDKVAFSGGLDITIRRWDTSEHLLQQPFRVDPAGKPYRPFHDVQAIVDGDAARALAEIAHARWECAGAAAGAQRPSGSDPWPESVAPDFADVQVAIARTQPAFEQQKEVREVEQLFFDSVAAAKRWVYIENQFFTCGKFANRLAKRLKENDALEVVLIAPQREESWLETRAMHNGRVRFARTFEEAGVADRVRILYPQIAEDGQTIDTMIHSKVMVVDDTFLRVGSANLSNRSMGTDTECDLAIEARTAAERHGVASVRNRLIGEHCGVSEKEVAAAMEGGSLIAAAGLRGDGRRLLPIDVGEPDARELAAYIEQIADPERPISFDALSHMFNGRSSRRRSTVMKVAAAALVLIALTLAWYLTPLAELADPDAVRTYFASFARSAWAGPVTVGAFVAAGLIGFPLTILIAATAAAFGPWLGLVYASTGALASALVTYAIGARIGRQAFREFLGPKLDRIRGRIARRGVLAIAAIRLVPIAPFTVVNLAAGASEIRPFDYIVGTVLGLAPGLIVLSMLGHQAVAIISNPTPISIAAFAAAVIAWIGVAVGAQVLVSRYASRTA